MPVDGGWSALAQEACRDGYSALYTRAPGHGTRRRQPAESAGPGQPHRCLGLRRLGDGAAIGTRAPRLLGDLRRPLPGTLDHSQQLPVSRWHEQIGDPTLADGILDRLVHKAHRIEMRGDSMRKSRGAIRVDALWSRTWTSTEAAPATSTGRRGLGLWCAPVDVSAVFQR